MEHYEHHYETDEESEPEVEVEVKPKRRGKKKKDPNRPKKFMTAYILYSNNVRSSVSAANPEAKFGDIVSPYQRIVVCTVKWIGPLALSWLPILTYTFRSVATGPFGFVIECLS